MHGRGPAALLALALAACTATPVQDAPPAPAPPEAPGPADACDPGVLAPQPLRRLNRTEYAASLRALLGSDEGVLETLPPEVGSRFETDVEALTVSPTLLEKLEALTHALTSKALLPAEQGGTGVRTQLLFCDPSTLEPRRCATELLGSFASRAWRRPVGSAEVQALLPLFELGQAEGLSFEESVQLGLSAILLSPHFLYRVEPDAEPTGAARLTGDALAVRLSYFLWSAPPDEALLRTAAEGRLQDDAQLAGHVGRMLAHPAARALVDGFGAQWLELRGVAHARPSPQRYPLFDEPLREALGAETRAFFADFLRSGRSALDLLDADFTFVNARLARHYGLPAPAEGEPGATGEAPAVVRVPLPPGRAGLLTQGSVLVNGSTSLRGSPTQRGRFILERLLCRPPPPPPENVDTNLEDGAAVDGPMRARLEAHRESPACAGCHVEMDPLGLTFEHFDATGAYRPNDEGHVIDTAGVLPDGRRFEDPAGLARLLKEDPAFSRCLTEQLFSYALGRAPAPEDACALHGITERFVQSGHRLDALVLAIVQSEPFRSRQAPPAEATP